MIKTFVTILFYFFFYWPSYAQENCKSEDYSSVKWQSINNIVSFFICTHDTIPFTSSGIVDIEFIGTLKKDEKIPETKSADKNLFTAFTNTTFRSYKVSESIALPVELKHVLKQMTKNSSAIVQYDFSSISPVKPERKLTVYFKEQTDSAKAAAWIMQVKQKPFIDSACYVSKELAANIWSKENPDWKSFIEKNPLPSSVDLFIKESYYDSVFIVLLKKDLQQDKLVSDVSYSNFAAEKTISDLNAMLTKKYFIRLSTKNN